MIKRTLVLAIMIIAICNFCFAQNIDGNWKGFINDKYEMNYTFKVNGKKLNGSQKVPGGADIQLSNGIIKGDDISFDVDNHGTPMKIKGRINGYTITLSFTFYGHDVIFDVKKLK